MAERERVVIGFSGHRDVNCQRRQLEALALEFPEALWVHGGADGFDWQVELFARSHGIETKILRPDYERWGRYEAPHVRNREIVALSKRMVICYDDRKSGGTYRTKEYAEAQVEAQRLQEVRLWFPDPTYNL